MPPRVPGCRCWPRTCATSLPLRHLAQYLRRGHLADVTEIFRQVAPRKRREMFKLAFYLLTFVLAIYK